MEKTDSEGNFILRGIPSPDLRIMAGALAKGNLSSLNTLVISVKSSEGIAETVNLKPISQALLEDARTFLMLWEQAAFIWNKEYKEIEEQMVPIKETGRLNFPESKGNQTFVNIVLDRKEKRQRHKSEK